ncbi:hypothetical protein E2C01_002685 [Portunus trituberculatus]|uniref:Uncharacterized protein n=1 Tax=Portunus trituberculatus TaxID=210409 RepID=A0A5B7CLW5_PORTR|nr:hypothetical protein [Portunus trituberculatus]
METDEAALKRPCEDGVADTILQYQRKILTYIHITIHYTGGGGCLNSSPLGHLVLKQHTKGSPSAYRVLTSTLGFT